MRIQRLTTDHVDQYRELMLRAYADSPDAFTATVPEREPLPLDWWRSRVDDDPSAPERIFGAFIEDRLVAVTGLRRADRPRTRHKATLFGMFVLQAHRKKGLGHTLVARVLEEARSMPRIRLVKLTVTESNTAAIALYESHGFQAFGVEPMAIRVGEGFAAKVHMWCPLEAATDEPA